MRNKRMQIVIITIGLLLLYPISAWASTLNIKTITDKEEYNVGDKVIVTIDWTEKMQAASFTLKYDATKLQFEAANIANTFYNKETAGVIDVNWASMEEIDYTKIVFNFKAISEGKVQISVENPNSFANENLVSPEGYNTNSAIKTINIKSIGDDKKEDNTINNTINNTTNSNQNNTIKKDNTTANGKMPQTGKETMTISFIVVLAIFAVVGLIKYKKLSDI